MARITKIEASGLRARSFSYDVEQLQVIRGDIGSSKTSAADAIRFAALGYVPSIGKSAEITSRLMNGRQMWVRLTFDHGRATIERTLEIYRGRLKSGCVCSWVDAGETTTRHAEEALAVFGSSRREVEEHLDLTVLLNATPNERAARIQEILDASAGDEDQVARLDALTYGRLAGREADAIETAKANVYRETIEDVYQIGAHKALCDILPNLEEGVERAIDEAKRLKNRAAESSRNRKAARVELEDRKMAMEIPESTIDDLDAEHRRCTDRLAVLRADAKRHQDAANARQEAAQALAAARANYDAIPDLETRRDQLRASLDETEVPEVGPAPSLAYRERDDVRRAREEVQENRDALVSLGDPPQEPRPPETQTIRMQQLQDRIDENRARAREALESPWQKVLDVADRLKPLNLAVADEIRQDLIDIAQPHIGRGLAYHQQAERDEAELRELTEQRQRAQAEFQNRIEEFQRAQVAYGQKRAEIFERIEDAQTVIDLAHDHHEILAKQAREAHEAARAHASRVRVERDRKREEMRDIDLQITRTRARYETLKAKAGAAIEEVDVDALAEEARDVEARIERLEATRETLQRYDALVSEIHTIASEITRADVDRECWAAVEWALIQIRAKDLGARGRPIIQIMRKFLDAAGFPHEPFFRAEKRQVDFGWIRDGEDVHVSALSGGESVIFNAALATAITTLRDPKCSVLLIEGAEAGPVQGNLLAGIEALRDNLDNAILTTWVTRPTPSAWGVIDLYARESAEA